MFHPSQGIFSQGWLDIIFEGRNKQYGAYVLRRDAGKHGTLALLAASSVFVVSLLVPALKSRFFPDTAVVAPNTFDPDREIILISPPPIDPATPVPPPPAAAPPSPRTSQVRMPEPRVTAADLVTEEPPSVADLMLKDPGPATIDGDPTADIRIDMPVGKGTGDAQVTESGASSEVPFVGVEIEPEFPGGMKAFLKYVQDNYRYPAAAVEHGVKGKIILSFIVERDGSLSDIKVIRDLRFGTGEEAVRLLSGSPKWSPGIQNGRAVRVAYTLPIGLDISQ